MSLFLHVVRSLGAVLGLVVITILTVLFVGALAGAEDEKTRAGVLVFLLLWLALNLLYIIPYLSRIIAGG